MLQSMSSWHRGTGTEDISNNVDAANRTFAMLLCARFFVFKQVVQHFPIDMDVTVARRRWVLAQVLPPRLTSEDDDLFVKVLLALRHTDTKITLGIVRSTLRALMAERRDLFPVEPVTPLFAVIDEVPVAADHLKEFFRPTAGTDLRPILREMHKFFHKSGIFAGIILSGTGLLKMVKEPMGSFSAKQMGNRVQRIFTNWTFRK